METLGRQKRRAGEALKRGVENQGGTDADDDEGTRLEARLGLKQRRNCDGRHGRDDKTNNGDGCIEDWGKI